MMKTHEREALLEYLEFHLVALCEQMEPHVSSEVLNELYAKAYHVLIDVEDAIATVQSFNSHKTQR